MASNEVTGAAANLRGVHRRNFEQFAEQMLQVDELAQVVLKGHLVLEEQLDRILGSFVFHQEHLEAADLNFYKKVFVARSMSLDGHNNSMWDLILTVNALRNELAHALQSEKREKKFDRLKRLYMAESDELPSEVDALENHVLASFAIVQALGFLGAFEEEVERFKRLVSVLDRVANPHRHRRRQE